MKPVILSCESLTLSDAEKTFFRELDPLGFILFKRNIDTPEQLKRLNAQLRDAVGRDAPILIDQEGGRVQRMGPPHWTACDAAMNCQTLDDVRRAATAIARDLSAADIDVNCAPVMDVLNAATHQAIGDRAFSGDPDDVFNKAMAVCDVFLAHGITPVVKHMPGQGRADVDSHHDLPVVSAPLDDLRAVDFVPFKRLSSHALAPSVWGMIAHVVYASIDPVHPATVSPDVIRAIRDDIGFKGLLVTDDVSMGAMKTYGNIAQRCKSMLSAGCDIALYCWAHINEMEEIAADIPAMTPATLERYDRSRLRRRPAA